MTDAHKQITDTELITELQRIANQHGPRVSKRDMQEHGEYSFMTYVKRFESWNNAIEAAGIEPNTKPGNYIPDEELITELQRVAEKLDRAPRKQDMDDHGKYSPDTYNERFDGWNAAVETAGLEPNTKPGNYIPTDELIGDLQRTAAEIDQEYVTKTAYNDHGEYHPATYNERFGSWREALDTTGLPSEPKRQHQTVEVPADDLLEELRRIADELGRAPRKQDMDEHGKYSATVYYDRFGSWPDAQEAASVNQTPNSATKIPEEELITELQRVADQHGPRVSKRDMQEHGEYSFMTYVKRFESWNNAVEAAGLEPNTRGAA